VPARLRLKLAVNLLRNQDAVIEGGKQFASLEPEQTAILMGVRAPER